MTFNRRPPREKSPSTDHTEGIDLPSENSEAEEEEEDE
jgi:hypothetical protein